MPQPVLDLGSNLEENLKRWSHALKGGGAKLNVWNVIYSGKRARWTAKDIAEKSQPKLTTKAVTIAGKKLHGDALIRQVPGTFPVVYEKIPDVHHYKNRILSLINNKAKRDALPTKRDSVNVRVTVRQPKDKQACAEEITIDSIDQFRRAKKVRGSKPLKPLPESRFKCGLQALFNDYGRHKDHGGEIDDFYTNQLRMSGKRYSAAFALKGPGAKVKTVTPGKWGKQGDQIQRLVEAPARVFILQSELQIGERSIQQLAKLTQLKAIQEKKELFYGVIDPHDSTKLRKAYPRAFRA